MREEHSRMCHLPWQAPVWDRLSNQKHRKSSTKSWDRKVTKAWTGQPEESAQFDPGITDAQIESMEIEATQGEGVQIQDKCHKRRFYRDMGQIIGASAGDDTTFIYVEYVNSGPVHGRPMTWKEIQDKIRRAKK